jgi:hypothetical protein
MGDMSEYYSGYGLYDQTVPTTKAKASEAKPMWTTHTGARMPVEKMDEAHLHYALAKAYRGEYPDQTSAARGEGIQNLKNEAARRLWQKSPALYNSLLGEAQKEIERLQQRLGAQGRTNASLADRLQKQENAARELVVDLQSKLDAAVASIIEEKAESYKNGTARGRIQAESKASDLVVDLQRKFDAACADTGRSVTQAYTKGVRDGREALAKQIKAVEERVAERDDENDEDEAAIRKLIENPNNEAQPFAKIISYDLGSARATFENVVIDDPMLRGFRAHFSRSQISRCPE